MWMKDVALAVKLKHSTVAVFVTLSSIGSGSIRWQQEAPSEILRLHQVVSRHSYARNSPQLSSTNEDN